MNAADALRFLAHEASNCRDHDSHEALCLWLPSMMRIFHSEPMNGYEAEAFKAEFKELLKNSYANGKTVSDRKHHFFNEQSQHQFRPGWLGQILS